MRLPPVLVTVAMITLATAAQARAAATQQVWRAVRAMALVAVITVLTAIAAGPAEARTGPFVWARGYLGNRCTVGQAVTTDPGTGAVYTFTRTGCTTESTDLIAYSSSGVHQWTADSGGTSDVALQVTVDPASHTILTAAWRYSVDNTADLLVQAWSPAGRKLWGKALGATNSFISAIGITVDQGTVFVGSTISNNNTGESDLLTVAYDVASGATRWHVRYNNGTGDNEMDAIAVDRSAHLLYVTGTDLFNDDVITVEYRESDGGVVGEPVQVGGFVGDDIAVDPGNHRVYVLGSEDAVRNVELFAYDGSLDPLWHVQWTDAGRHDATGWHVAVDPTTHRVFFSGKQHTRAFLVAVSPQGAVVWNDEDVTAQGVTPVGLAIDPSAGRVYVTGTMAVPPTTDRIVTWADTTAGERVWHAERGTSGRTRAAAIRADPDRGQVYVVGTAPKGGSTGSLTIAYTA